ncbi:MAG: hypothetical protein KGI79_00295 [Patescibacteria group bacterium]|nr:hypothetical protein [Patescibacteria group bacterium]MDE2116311.1 hypothetical protein [Patescibacteria group bacterium]
MDTTDSRSRHHDLSTMTISEFFKEWVKKQRSRTLRLLIAALLVLPLCGGLGAFVAFPHNTVALMIATFAGGFTGSTLAPYPIRILKARKKKKEIRNTFGPER